MVIIEIKFEIVMKKYNTVDSAYCGLRLIWATNGLVPIPTYTNKVIKTRIIWALGSIYVGNIYFIIALEND